jgi:biopolymer transport protein ExbD
VQSVEAAQISVTLDADEQLWIDGEAVSVGEVGSILESRVENHPQDTLVHVNVHKDHTWKTCRPVIEALSATGVKFIFTGVRADP